MTRQKFSDFHGGVQFQSSFSIRWELEDKTFLKIYIICLDDSLKYRIMANNKWKLHSYLQRRNFQKASRDRLSNRFWTDTRLLSVKVKCPDPGIASHEQKPNKEDSLRHQIPVPCPHSPPPCPPPPPPPPPHGIYIDWCIMARKCNIGVQKTISKS